MRVRLTANKPQGLNIPMSRLLVRLLFVSFLFTSVVSFANDAVIKEAFVTQKSDIHVQGSGTVIRVLADDNDGSRHQRFIIRLSSNQTLLVAHNIDFAPRVAGIEVGDTIGFYGEYEWNEQGGVIHWTHADPNGRHVGGWLKHEGAIYQ